MELQSSFITRACANKLGLSKFNVSLSLQGLDEMTASAKSGVVCTISSLYDSYQTFDVNAIILDKICHNVPGLSFNIQNYPSLKNLKLADPNFWRSDKVDMLLGNDIYPYILQDGRISNGPNQPVCINTIFGWAVMGKITLNPSSTNLLNLSQTLFMQSSDSTLDHTLQAFWECEKVPEATCRSPEDLHCENYFTETTKVSPEGRYTVSLPFKIAAPDFGDTRTLALHRFFIFRKTIF